MKEVVIMKITAKTTKEQLKKFLGANVAKVRRKDKDLFDRIAYADKMLKKDEGKVTKKDLMDLAKAVMQLLGDKVVDPETKTLKVVAENSTKKGVTETVVELPKKGAKSDTKNDTKKDSKKKLTKKTPKEEEVKNVKSVDTERSIQLAEMFPETLTVEDNKYKLASDIKTMDNLYDALMKEEEIVFAYYWTKRHLRQFPYYGGLLGQPKSFDHDLDLASCIYVADNKKVAYEVSLYTDALYANIPEDFKDEDGVRIANGIEFQIYRQVDTEEKK